MTDEPIFVTRPLMPPLAELTPYLEQIWATRQLTNGGPMHEALEARLADYLQVDHLALVNNGTTALLIALKASGASGEVITTPYSFAATAHCLTWSGLSPVFVDIDPVTCNLDPDAIEAAITPATSAILPVHCYGRPCRTAAIDAIARKHGLKVIYDAAHAFGVGEPGLLRQGDLSTLSFHATKVFHTFEGGAIACPDAETKASVDLLKNFGFANDVDILAVGVNGKMNEFQAAMGLVQLDHVAGAIERRSRTDAFYRRRLAGVAGVQPLAPIERSNHAYFPVLIEADRDGVFERMKLKGVFARRYFYPLISRMPMYRDLPSADPARLPNAHFVADRVLCLPIYDHLAESDAMRVIDALMGALGA